MLVCEQDGRVNGPAFATADGELALSVNYDSIFRRYLLRVQEETNLILEDQDVESHYSIQWLGWKARVLGTSSSIG